MFLQADTTIMLSLVPQINPKSKAKDAENQKTAEKTEKSK